MRQDTVARVCALLLITCVSCADAERATTDAGARLSDAGTDAATHDLDAAPSISVDASVDLHFLLIALLLETERSLLARCPCLTASGQYESTSDCRSAVSLGRNWIDCANRVDLRADDSEALREDLRCNIAELSLRTDCLMGTSCMDDAVATCMTQSLACATLPYEVISKVVSECTITLSR